MNQGIFGFPTTLSGSVISVSEFDASGTYTIPEDITSLEILLVGGGGGGGGGARSTGTNTTSGGGGGGSGGGIVHQIFYKKELQNIRNLIITIGLGGGGGPSRTQEQTLNTGQAGGAAQPGGNSYVRTNENPLFIMGVQGGGGGGAGTTPTAVGAAAGGPGRNFYIASTPTTMAPGAVSSATVDTNASGPDVQYVNFRYNIGAGGGSATTTTNALRGGAVRIPSSTYNDPLVVNMSYAGITLEGITAAYGGNINSGNAGGKGEDGQALYRLSSGSQYFSGFGGAGGGGANTVGGGNGGRGYRGGGGGGGGGVRSSTGLNINQVPSGAGGDGGNGYCRIIARK